MANTFPCKNVKNVSIDNNYGIDSNLYNLSIDVNFNSPTTFEASFVSKNGNYDNVELNTQIPNTLTIGEKSFSIYPITYKKTNSASGKLLVVKYVDGSVKFLDKKIVAYDFLKNYQNIIPIIPTKIAVGSGSDLDVGNYTPKKLLDQMISMKIPLSDKVRNFLNQFSENNIAENIAAMAFNSVGTLRSILDDIGNLFGMLFFWNWMDTSKGADGCLDIFDITSSNFDTLSNSLKNLYDKISIDESGSIEDNSNSMELIYDVSSIGNSISTLTITFSYLDIMRARNGFDINYWQGPKKKEFIKTDYFKKTSFYEMCSASLVGREFFKHYVLWHLAVGSYLKYGPKALLFYTDGEMEQDENLPIKLIEIESSNDSVLDIFEDSFGPLIRNTMESETDNSPLNQKCPIQIILTKASSVTFIDFIKNMKEQYPMRAELANEIFKRESMVINFENPLIVIAYREAEFKESIDRLYDTCNLIANNIFRWWVSSPKTVTKREYQDYSIGQDWLYEEGGMRDTPLASIANYLIKFANEIKEQEGSDSQDIKLKEYIEDGATKFKDVEKDDGSCSHRGYLLHDGAPARSSNVVNDILIKELEINTDLLYNQQLKKDHGLTNILIYKMNAVSALKNGPKKTDIGFIDGKDSLSMINESKRSRYVKSSQASLGSWIWRYLDIGSSSPLNMSNILNITKAPFLNQTSLSSTSTEATSNLPGQETRSDNEDCGSSSGTNITLVEKSYNIDEWIVNLNQYKKNNLIINKNLTISVVGIIEPGANWIEQGLESYSISIGSDGSTTTMSCGTRKKSAQTFENFMRVGREDTGFQNTKSKKRSIPSIKRSSQGMAIRTFQ